MKNESFSQSNTINDDELSLKSKKNPRFTTSSPILKGILQAMPIVVGYLPLSFAFGVMAHDARLSFFATTLMSLIVFAGSSQYVAIAMFASAQPIISIVFTTFIINLRHLLMSTAIAPHLKKWTTLQRFIFGTELTDETFALHSVWLTQHSANAKQNIVTNMTAHASWLTGTMLGYIFGSILGDVKIYGFDFALSAMFIALLVMQVKNRLTVLVCVFSASLAILCYVYSFKTWAVITAAIIGATLGAVCELCQTRSSS